MIMAPMSKMLVTDEDVAAVAVYVSSLKAKTIEHMIAKGDRQEGKELYKACCIACHGDMAQGKKEFKSPKLTGRNDWYMRTQIRKFKTNIRGSHPEDLTGVTMRPMAMTLKTDGVIRDVIAYIKTLAE
jgi:cytochrome c oxidase subunit 2